MDIIECEVLEDGTISIKTNRISPENHVSADKLLIELEKAMGGERTVKSRTNAPVHQHTHDHTHTHGHTHEH